MQKHKLPIYLATAVSAVLYLLLGYGIERPDTVALLSSYTALFTLYVWIIKSGSESDLKFWLVVALLFRLLFIASLPVLSDDFYRFIWDGRLIVNGIHPFAELPTFYLQPEHTVPGVNQGLFDRLNSQDYFTVYPPLAQAVFFLSVYISPDSILGSVLIMRVLILLAEVGTCFLLMKFLDEFGLKRERVLIYALNPLIILELTGNLHFEAFLIFFVVLCLFLLSRTKIVLAGVSMAIAIASKLIPLIFLPLFVGRIKTVQLIVFFISVAITLLLMFYPLVNDNGFDGLTESLKLYFKSFEFNASIYYLVREYGFWTKGYNTIQTVGWKLGVISAMLISFVSLWRYELKRGAKGLSLIPQSDVPEDSLKRIPLVMMWVLTIYLLFATTVHPWYVTTLVMLSVLTGYRFALIWSGMIFLTYSGYTSTGYNENLWIVFVEYLSVIGYLAYELVWTRKSSSV
ncbi:MAG: glycosyltransferase 87 family protein [Cyclobacteriaceae bacterium]